MAKNAGKWVVGRALDCDLVVDHPTVSAHHLRISWQGDRVLIEDLGSTYGTFVGEQRVTKASVRPGDVVMIGQVALPWDHPSLEPFLRMATKGAIVAPPTLTGTVLRSILRIVAVLLAIGAALIGGLWLTNPGRNALAYLWLQQRAATESDDEENFVRTTMISQVRRALDPTEPTVRNIAMQVTTRSQGRPFGVEQLAAIWSYLRERWRYVNDPRGREYVTLPRESMQNGYAGDADDFALALAAMVRAIGGEARIVFVEGSRGGHAYAEVCVQESPTIVATKIARYYRRDWARYAPGRQQIAFRSSQSCPVWLNLDWNAIVPGGEYEPERWAIAVYPDGQTEVLAVAPGAEPTERARQAPVASAPRRVSIRPVDAGR